MCFTTAGPEQMSITMFVTKDALSHYKYVTLTHIYFDPKDDYCSQDILSPCVFGAWSSCLADGLEPDILMRLSG